MSLSLRQPHNPFGIDDEEQQSSEAAGCPILQGYGAKWTILLVPLFFGICHLHHAYEYVVHWGYSLQKAILTVCTVLYIVQLYLQGIHTLEMPINCCSSSISCSATGMLYEMRPQAPLTLCQYRGVNQNLQVAFQCAFTTLFGCYAAFVFVRSGHLAAAYGVHAFCNLMGFPDISAIASHPRPGLIRAAFLLGIFLFCVLLRPLTDPGLFANTSVGGVPGNAYLHCAHNLSRNRSSTCDEGRD
jgi:hypothetical protein